MIFVLLFIGLVVIAIVIALVLSVRWFARMKSGDPLVWERAIRAFEKDDQRISPPPHPLLFTGSSSIHFWHTLQKDMQPLPVLNRGFGGSQIANVTYYADRIVLPYAPRAIIFYAGENDIAFETIKAEQVAANFAHFCEKVHTSLPDVPIYFISIKPPKKRQEFWPSMQLANALVRAYCTSEPLLHFIDITPSMLDTTGNVRGELFRRDGIHLNDQGYALWTATIKPILIAAFGA